MSVNTIHRIPRFKRAYPSAFSYRAELLYGRRFAAKLQAIKQSQKKPSDNLDDIVIIRYGQRFCRYTEIRKRTAGII